MAWLYLLLAGVFEILWVTSLKWTQGYTRAGFSLLNITFMACSLYLVSVAVRSIPMGTAYAIWTGMGAVGAVAIGILFYHEPATPLRLLCIVLIIAGMAGLKLAHN